MGNRDSTVKNIFFYCFMFLMVCAKGFGLDSGDRAYYVLALMAMPFWVFSILWTRWSPETLAAAALMLAAAIAAVAVNGKLGVTLSVMSMAAMKDVDREGLMRKILGWWLCSVGARLALVLAGIVPDEVVSLGHKVYHTMGYGTGNLLHATIAVLSMLYLYNRKRKVTLLEEAAILAVNLAAYRYSASRGGLLAAAAAVLTSYGFKLFAGSQRAKGLLRGGLCLGIAAVPVLSFALPYAYGTGSVAGRLADVLNGMFTGRIMHSRTALLGDPVTLLGNPGGTSAFLDNAYVYLLVKCGILSSLLLFVLYAMAVRSMARRKDDYGLLLAFWFVCYGFVEQLFVNSFLNYSMLIVGHEVMNVVLRRRCVSGKEAAGRAGWEPGGLRWDMQGADCRRDRGRVPWTVKPAAGRPD